MSGAKLGILFAVIFVLLVLAWRGYVIKKGGRK
jgi:hypothetical protein